jgi:hypothetical protein
MRWTERLAWLNRNFPGFPKGGHVFASPDEPPLTFDRKPRIRWFACGWWICQDEGTELGRGGTPAAAYQDWLDRLAWPDLSEVYGGAWPEISRSLCRLESATQRLRSLAQVSQPVAKRGTHQEQQCSSSTSTK